MITLDAKVFKRLLDLAEAEFPRESCALLIGRRIVGDSCRIIRVEPSRNIAKEPERRFEIDPGLRIGLERELRGRKAMIVGVWHSHPGASAHPSAYDAASVHEPALLWLITSVLEGQAMQTNAFMPEGPGFRPVPFMLT